MAKFKIMATLPRFLFMVISQTLYFKKSRTERTVVKVTSFILKFVLTFTLNISVTNSS